MNGHVELQLFRITALIQTFFFRHSDKVNKIKLVV